MRLSIVQNSHSPDSAIRVFPARTKWTPTDAMAFVGEAPMFLPSVPRTTPVLISSTFTWHKSECERIARTWAQHFENVTIGGPAFDDPGDEFTPGLFLRHGCTITSRGCPKKCGWCVVPKRSGKLRELTIKPGWIVQDDNLLASSEGHLREVFDMLRSQDRAIYFNGGLDKHFLEEWHRKELFDSIRIGELWFACDVAKDLPSMERAKRILAGISIEKLRCYTMIGFDDETPAEAERRLERVYELGFLPFCQLFQPMNAPLKVYSDEWRKIHRKWSRPAAYRSKIAQSEVGLFS